jgi:hypothetical protein
MTFVCVANKTGDAIRFCLFLGPIAKVDALYDAGHLDGDEVRPSLIKVRACRLQDERGDVKDLKSKIFH